MNFFSKLLSSDPTVSCGRIIALFFALLAAAGYIWCVFFRGALLPTEEKVIEFFGGFAVSAYTGAKVGESFGSTPKPL